MNPFKGRHCERHIILWAVRWYCKYGCAGTGVNLPVLSHGISMKPT